MLKSDSRSTRDVTFGKVDSSVVEVSIEKTFIKVVPRIVGGECWAVVVSLYNFYSFPRTCRELLPYKHATSIRNFFFFRTRGPSKRCQTATS